MTNEFFSVVNVDVFESDNKFKKEAQVQKNIKIEDGPYYKEKTIENLLRIYGCHSDNHVLTKTKEAVFVRRFDPKNKSVWKICDFAIVRFKQVEIED